MEDSITELYDHSTGNKDIAIKVEEVSKIYPLYNRPIDRLIESIHPFRKIYHQNFYALDKISFEIVRGQTVGIIGQNGSGKSTLLKIITGVLTPSSGKIHVSGKIYSLLELGTGFNPELTGMENVYFNGTINGYSRTEIEAKLDEVLSFADIGNFIHQPVKTYSSGMFVRLAFAVAIHIDPDIFIIDEALSVGDVKFQAKCFAKLKKMMNTGKTILFVTHSTEQVITHCKQAILLNHGKIQSIGKPKHVVNIYLDILFGKKKAEVIEGSLQEKTQAVENKDEIGLNSDFHKRPYYNSSEYRWGDKEAEITDFIVRANEGDFPNIINSSSILTFYFKVVAKVDIERPIFGFAVKTKEGITIYNTNTDIQEVEKFKSLSKGEERIIQIEFPVKLFSGDYFISIGIASRNLEMEIIPHDRRYDAIHIKIAPTPHFLGLTDLEVKFK